MTALADARAHLAKAREFVEAARSSHEHDLYNAATSNAVISGINSKDAICLRLIGVTRKSDGHQEAVAELKSAGPVGKELASTFSRLLKLKTKSQYQSHLWQPRMRPRRSSGQNGCWRSQRRQFRPADETAYVTSTT